MGLLPREKHVLLTNIFESHVILSGSEESPYFVFFKCRDSSLAALAQNDSSFDCGREVVLSYRNFRQNSK